MKICEVWLVLKEVKALLPVASLWASLDYKSVANWPIMVSRILLLTKLISEINPKIRFQESSLLGKDTSYDISCDTAHSKPVKQEVNGTVMLPPFCIPWVQPYLVG
jgi:hypothetical protein